MPMNVPISDDYRGPLRSAVITSLIITVLAVLTLDGGQTGQLSGIGLSIFWGWIFTGMWLRPLTPTGVDLLLIRWGCLPFIVGFQVAMFYAWHLRGFW